MARELIQQFINAIQWAMIIVGLAYISSYLWQAPLGW
jgi:hypothetical protein